MSITSEIVESPGKWNGARVVDELPLRMFDDFDRRRDTGLPVWLRDILVLCDFETHVATEGLLGWWENRSTEDLDLVSAALRSVGLARQADDLREVAEVFGPNGVGIDTSHGLSPVSSFSERHPEVTDEQLKKLRMFEERLWRNQSPGTDLYSLLVTHADAGLATMKHTG